MVANGTAEQLANEGTAALNEAASNGLVALYNSEEEERGRATIESDALHRRSGIIWSKASIRGGHWIILPINKGLALSHLGNAFGPFRWFSW
jgi:hypothetical protein